MKLQAMSILILAALAALPSIALPVYGQVPRIRIISPESHAVWVGPTDIRIVLENIGTDKVRLVEVFVDGKLYMQLKETPYDCRYDFGEKPATRSIKVIAHVYGEPVLTDQVQSAEIDEAYVVRVTRVFIPVTVLDSDGNYVPGLSKDDFIVTEESKPQPILELTLSDRSVLHLMLLIDISSSMKDKISEVKAAARTMLSRLLFRQNKAMVVFFNRDVFHENSDFTNDASDLFSPIASIVPFGNTAFYDAVNYCFRYLRPVSGRNIIVLFSDGEDNSSFIDPYTLIKKAERANTAIYAVGSMLTSTEDSQYHDLMDTLATSSGGLTFYLDDIKEVQRVYQQILQDIVSTYVLQISSKDLGTRKFRSISVKLKPKKGYSVRTIKGYYN